ncbi:MAG: hypothetical protein WBV93_19345 [Anaerobacillus sp.]
MRRVMIALLGAFLLLVCGFHSTAFASSIISNHATVVQQDKQVDNVIVYGKDVQVKGHVKTALIVIDGNLLIEKDAKLDGYVLVLGGDIEQEEGAGAPDEVFQLNFNDRSLNSMLLGGLTVAGYSVIKLLLTLLLLLISFLIGYLGEQKVFHVSETLRTRFGRVFLTGTVVSTLLLFLFSLLILSVFGIPIVLVLMIPCFIFWFITIAAIGQMVGYQMSATNERPVWATLLVGLIILVSLLNFPMIGFIFVLLSGLISNGYMMEWLISRFRKRA